MHELLQTVSSLEFEEYGGLRLVEVAWPDRGCQLQFRVWPGEPAAEDDSASEPDFEDWLVECEDVRAARVMLEWSDSLALTTEHPLLWSYREGETELAFRGAPTDAAAVVVAIWAEHRAVAADWIPFGDHLNLFDQTSPLVSLLRTGGGIFAAGPRPLMEAYARVLRSHGLDASFVGGHCLGAIEGEREDFAALLFGRSYVIGSRFTARRADHSAPVA